jgi:anthranilate phosphoribosyltransferase
VLGVFASRLTDLLASVLGNLGVVDAMVVHGADGLDEITVCDGTRISRYRDRGVETSYMTPEDYGFNRAAMEALAGGNKEDNALITLSILNGEDGPRRDIVLLNSAAALIVGGVTEEFSTGIDMAADAIDSKRALQKLEEVKRVTNSL